MARRAEGLAALVRVITDQQKQSPTTKPHTISSASGLAVVLAQSGCEQAVARRAEGLAALVRVVGHAGKPLLDPFQATAQLLHHHHRAQRLRHRAEAD